MTPDWLKVGSSFKVEQKEIKVEDKKEKKKKKHKEKKQHKRDQLSQQEIDILYDSIVDKKYDIDMSQGFIYRHDLGSDLLSVQLLPFGDPKIYHYGHLNDEIPSYHKNREYQNDDRCMRYTDINPDVQSFHIPTLCPLEPDAAFVPFTTTFIEPNIMQFDAPKRSVELQKLIQSHPNNLEHWIELVNLQDQLAQIYGYNTPELIIERKISIIQRLEQSTTLGSNSDVVAFKNFLIESYQNLQKYV